MSVDLPHKDLLTEVHKYEIIPLKLKLPSFDIISKKKEKLDKL